MTDTQIPNITANLKISDISLDSKGTPIINQNVIKHCPGMLLIWGNFCGHCHKFLPTFQEVNQRLNGSSLSFPCVAIENNELKKSENKTSALNFSGFPTIKYFDQTGKIIGEHQGERDTKSLFKEICNIYHHCIEYHS